VAAAAAAASAAVVVALGVGQEAEMEVEAAVEVEVEVAVSDGACKAAIHAFVAMHEHLCCSLIPGTWLMMVGRWTGGRLDGSMSQAFLDLLLAFLVFLLHVFPRTGLAPLLFPFSMLSSVTSWLPFLLNCPGFADHH